MNLLSIKLFLAFVTLQQDKPDFLELFDNEEYQIITEYYHENSFSFDDLRNEECQAILKSLYFQKEYKKCIEFSKTFIKKLWTENNYYEIYAANYYLSSSFKYSNMLDSAKFYFEEGLEAAYLTENSKNISRALNSISLIAERQRDYTTSISIMEEAMRINSDTTDKAKILSNIAYNYFRLGLLDSALHLNSKALSYFEKHNIKNDDIWNWRIRFRMGHIEKRLKNKEAINYFKESLSYTSGKSRNHILSLSGIGQSHIGHNSDSAIYYLNLAYEIAKENDDNISIGSDINPHLADYYIEIKNLPNLVSIIKEGKAISTERKDMLGVSSYLIKESSYYQLIDDQIKSITSINAAIDTLKKYHLKSNLADALTRKFEALDHFGRYKEAIEVKEEEIKVREDLFNDRSEAVYQILRTQNEMDKQESTIANQQLEIDNNNLQITIMYISIALVISALVFIFWQYRTRSKYAQKLETMFLDSRHRYMNNLLLLKNWFNEGKTENNDEIISFAQNRIDAISTVNRHLDRLSYNKDTIESQSFLEDISHNLLANREFTSEIDNVPINMSVSGPLGMITNEIITNGLKYGEEPYAIRFHKNGQGYILEIEDHGPGIADPEKKGTGSKVLRLLSRQLKGELTYENKADHSPEGRGTLVSLKFKG